MHSLSASKKILLADAEQQVALSSFSSRRVKSAKSSKSRDNIRSKPNSVKSNRLEPIMGGMQPELDSVALAELQKIE